MNSSIDIHQLPLWGSVRRRVRPLRQVVASFLHLGAGVQSSCLAEMIAVGDLPLVDAAIFCDTQDEPSWVYEQVDYLRGRLAAVGIPLVTVTAGNMIEDMKAYGRGERQRFANMPLFTEGGGQIRRQCTQEYKIEPSQDFTLAWLMARGYAAVIADKHGRMRRRVKAGVGVLDLYGISWDEFWRSGKRGRTWQHAVYPLIERRMSRADCVRWLEARGLPVPRKSACRVCPFHDDDYWRTLKREYLADFDHACRFDDWLRSPEAAEGFKRGLRRVVYLHPSRRPLRDLDFEGTLDGLPLFDLCGDHCMT